MRILSLDFETLSKADIKEVGAAKYASDPSTVPTMLAYGFTVNDVNQWLLDRREYFKAGSPAIKPGIPNDLLDYVKDPNVVFHALNAAFEIYVWQYVCTDRWGWPSVPLNRWVCTAAAAAAANLPRSLDRLTKRLNLPEDAKKSAIGKELIKQLSTPTKCQKSYRKAVKGKDGKNKTHMVDGKKRVVYEINKTSEKYQREIGNEVFDHPGKNGKLYPHFFNQDDELYRQFAEYNKQDVVAEIAARTKIPEFPESELDLWRIDREMNMRGITVDRDLCEGAVSVYEVAINHAHARMSDITDGFVEKCSQGVKLVAWLNQYLDWSTMFDNSLAKPIIPDFIDQHKPKNPVSEIEWMIPKGDPPKSWGCLPWNDPDEAVRIMPAILEALYLRDFAGGTAVSKYNAGLKYYHDDGRIRDQILYCGAATGRYSGKGIQPHNMKRSKTLDETFVNALKSGDYDFVEMIAEMSGKTVFEVLNGCVRGLVYAGDGYWLIVSDFAGIESRVLNWLVGCEYKLELFRRNEDTYVHAACPIYEVLFDEITYFDEKENKRIILPEHEEKRQVGKACELGLGYGMGAGTWRSGALKQGMEFSHEFAQEVVTKWRNASPEIPAFWRDIEDACKAVIRNEQERKRCSRNPPSRLVKNVCGIKVGWHPRGFLILGLPSGRKLFYYAATIMKDRSPDAMNEYPQIFYLDGGKMGSRQNGHRINTYGGKLCENIVQAIARDLLVNSHKIVHKAGFEVMFHVHDELVVRVHEDQIDRAFDTIHNAMETIPDWAAGLPLKAETSKTFRYSK